MTAQVVETLVILKTVLFRTTIQTFYLPIEYETLEVTQDKLVSHSRQKKRATKFIVNLTYHQSSNSFLQTPVVLQTASSYHPHSR